MMGVDEGNILLIVMEVEMMMVNCLNNFSYGNT